MPSLFKKFSNFCAGKKNSLFNLLWLVYFASNLGRLSYVACMIDIVSREKISPASAGLVVTGFFICYGLGQIAAGYIGGRRSPFKLIFAGLFSTALANLSMGFVHTGASMLIIWSFNGLFQAIIWPPVLRIIVEYYSEPERSKLCINISTTYPIAVMFAYISCAGIITVLSYRAVFFIFSSFLFAVSGIWLLFFRKTSRVLLSEQAVSRKTAMADGGISNFETGSNIQKMKYKDFFAGKNAPGFTVVLFCLVLVIQGAFRDGLMTWVPAYTAKVFDLPSNTAILSAGFIPLINLAGIYVCRILYNRKKDEGKLAFFLFSVTSLAALVLRFTGGYHLFLTLFFFAVITGCMMGINLILVTFVPARFSRFGLTPFLTGLTNSMVYVGSSISTVGIASTVEKTGWEGFLTLLVILAMVSALLCAIAAVRWTPFVNKQNFIHKRYMT